MNSSLSSGSGSALRKQGKNNMRKSLHVQLTCRFRVRDSDRVDLWSYLVEILLFASPTGYMLTLSDFRLLNWGITYKFL